MSDRNERRDVKMKIYKSITELIGKLLFLRCQILNRINSLRQESL